MSLPKYKYLLTYRYAEMICDLTVEFCQRFLSSYKDRRTIEQMTQAARSTKQNIIEGVGQSATSKKGEIKLLGVAYASLEELIADYEDFLRQRKLTIWQKQDPRVLHFRQVGYRLSNISNLSDLGYLKEKAQLPKSAEESSNFLLTLCHMESYLLSRQIQKAEQNFITKGGFTEELFKNRVEYRKKLRFVPVAQMDRAEVS